MWWRRLRWLLALIAVSALATCPIGWRSCRNEKRAREADQLLRYLGQQARKGDPAMLSRTPAGPTPAIGACCEQDDGQCAVDQAQWQTPGWQAFAFSIDDPHRFSYSYSPSPDGGGVFRAIGDVDCDGVQTTVELRYARDPKDPEKLVETWAR